MILIKKPLRGSDETIVSRIGNKVKRQFIRRNPAQVIKTERGISETEAHSNSNRIQS